MERKTMEYFEKLDKNPYEDLYWNLPEQKRGMVKVIGGNERNFRTVVKTAEFLVGKYPLEVVAVLPESLRKQLSELDSLEFLPATEQGAFNGEGLGEALAQADYNVVVGDFSKNAITGKGVAEALGKAEKPAIITRDAVDLVAENGAETVLMNEKVSFLASGAQLQKLLRAVYYPKMMTLSQPLMQVVEILHKITLSYPMGLVVLYEGQILVAKGGQVRAVAVTESGYSPITLWNGELAAKIAALNVYNPGDFVGATVAAIYH